VTAPKIRETLKVLLQMAVVLTYAGGKPVIKVGRIAGQFAKPRSSDTEMVDGVEIPSYRGDMVNRPEPSEEARIPNPKYMLKGYNMAASTLNLLRAFTRGGFATLQRVHSWNQEFVIQSPMGRSYERMAKQIEQAIKFMETIGISTDNPQINQTELFTSHEALLLEYEEAMTRVIPPPTAGMTVPAICCGSVNGPGRSTVPTSSSCAASSTRLGSRSVRPIISMTSSAWWRSSIPPTNLVESPSSPDWG